MQNPFLPDHRQLDAMGHQERIEAQLAFIKEAGWDQADIYPMTGDASTRTYTRLVMGKGRVLLMDAKPPLENLEAYLQVSAALKRMGLRVPEVTASNTKDGFALIEDFGDKTFTNILKNTDSTAEIDLYQLAATILVHLREEGVPQALEVPLYSLPKLLEEASRCLKWFMPKVRGAEVTPGEQQAFEAAWEKVLAPIAARSEVLVHRDFHVDNLMLLEEETGLKRCGLLDFQDAVIGVPAYDLVSLLEDARRDVPATTYTAVIDTYTEGWSKENIRQLKEDMTILGAQRHTKILGIFVRMSVERGKDAYLDYLPRVQQQLETSLASPLLAEVKSVMDAIAPDWATITISGS